MNQTFSFNNMSATLISTTDEVVMNVARYQARVIKSRARSATDGPGVMNSVVRFSLILAHVVDTKGFPFAVPDPFAHPETVGLAWDAYMTEDPALWDQLLKAIEMSAAVMKKIADKLPEAIAEMDAVSAHNISPFKRKHSEKGRT